MKAKVYSLKLGPMILSFKRKLKEEKKPTPKNDILAADRYQAAHFGYKPLGFVRHFMSADRIAHHMEKSFSEQPEKAKARFYQAMKRQGARREKFIQAATK